MKGYSKIKIFNPTSAKSRSIDLSYPLTSSELKKANSQTDTDSKPQEKITSQLQNFNYTNTKPTTTITNTATANENLQDSLSWLQDEEGYKESSKLGRNSSVSSASGFQSAVKKAFSMRRSSSVSESYCRIHDQSSGFPSPTHDDEDDGSPTRSVKKKNSRSRILRACKKLVGL
ncbi:uncharacterized protein LOC110624530 [Manihot esculenta]|uniref:Uncharacterized protein n=1 Tax=Manihot esculenta TaxID=3983 RepID=A0A2C9V701_MANES|nr:uncharacterized protein LOC110624530 [Manihot esculenta]OAY39713.1 hypothetical protein MANES_10G117000v8 [Manihot esculenta]